MAMMSWVDMTLLQRLDWEDANRPFNPKSARAIRNKYTSKGPDNQLSKGYVKKLKKFNPNFRNAARSEQKASHKLDRRAAKKQIELGLQDYELDLQAEQADMANDMMMCGYGYEEDSGLDDFLSYYQPQEDLYELDDCFEDFSEPEEPSRLKVASYDYAIVDELSLMWQYEHEGD